MTVAVPEYISFKTNPWNCAILTARQHFVAHIILWKTYHNRSTTLTVYYLKKTKNYKMNSRLYEKLKIERSKHISDCSSKLNSGKVNIKDEFGNIIKITVDEFKNGNFKGQHSDTVMVTDGTSSFRVSKYDTRFLSGELVGHTRGKTYAIDNYGNGHFVDKNDPRFKTGDLKGNNADTITITNGKTNKRIHTDESIPYGWYRGMTKDSPKGSIWINNGKTSKMFKGDQIPNGWTKGRIFNKKSKPVGTFGKIWITNNINSKLIKKDQDIPQGWKKGRSFSH